MNEETKKTILDLAEKVDVLQPFQIKAELIRILQLNSKQLGYSEAFNNCTEEIAKVLENHFPEIIEVEDMSRINNLVDEEIVHAGRRQHEQNLMDEINGGSR